MNVTSFEYAEWCDFPVITADSKIAAEACLCAYEQGNFWDYHEIVLKNAPDFRMVDLDEFAVEAGLKYEVLDQCLDNGLHFSESCNLRILLSIILRTGEGIGERTCESCTYQKNEKKHAFQRTAYFPIHTHFLVN